MDTQAQDDAEWALFADDLRKLTLTEIEERYYMTGIISQNRNASVRLGIHKITGEHVAIKIMNKNNLREQHKKLLLLREIKTMKILGDQKHVTELYDVIDSGDRIWIVMEYASGGELFDFVRAKNGPLPDSVARTIFRPIVKVVAYMHSKSLVHRDLKLENILLDGQGRLRLADFGFSRYFNPADGLVDSICGTAHYSPPEIVKGLPHNPIYADSWCLGVIFYVLIFGHLPFQSPSISEMLQLIMKADVQFSFEPSQACADLLHRLLAYEPAERLTAQEVMKHPWMNKNRLPKGSKRDHTQRINRAALQEIRSLNIISDINADLDTDQEICYRLIRRKYQLGITPLPAVTVPAPGFDHSMRKFPVLIHPRPQTSLSAVKKARASPLGMKNDEVSERIPKSNTFIRIEHYNTKKPRLKPLNQKHQIDGARKNIRDLQTMRLRTLLKDGAQLPRFDCEHTTLDPPELLWDKLLQFISKQESMDIICEHDYSLYCKLYEDGYPDLDFVISLGCVHSGFGLIGFNLKKIHGDEQMFRIFEDNLVNFLGF